MMEDRYSSDTIAAIATAMSNSGIGIVRVSGSEACMIVDRIFRGGKDGRSEKRLTEVPSHTVHYGMIQDGEEVIDEVMVIVMRGPHSYTAEDTVEIDCHGGVLVMKRILETVIRYGARPAEPGEFTKRAFLNGRIDLSQAEAVMELIQSRNRYAMESSVNQLKGSVSWKIGKLREDILYHLAYIESALDDPEHISLDGYGEALLQVLEPLVQELEKLIASADNGRIISEGVRTVILGKPNVGKSSLMNALLGEERAIVTDIAGTTRDTLEAQISLRGITLNVVDTAGIRKTDDLVEQIGVSRAREVADKADFILYVVDGSCPLDENDAQIMELIRGRKAVVLLNKTDLKLVVDQEQLAMGTGCPVIPVSVREETGIGELEKTIEEMFYKGSIDFNDQVMITSVRHKAALEAALGSLNMVIDGIRGGMPEDFLTIDLMDAYKYLGLIIGEAVEDDLVNEIFGKFCMGK